ncbi:MAG: hypothetical protein ACQETF_02965 [Bacteroidota bacterium]
MFFKSVTGSTANATACKERSRELGGFEKRRGFSTALEMTGVILQLAIFRSKDTTLADPVGAARFSPPGEVTFFISIFSDSFPEPLIS